MNVTFENKPVQEAFAKLQELEKSKMDFVCPANKIYLDDGCLMVDDITYTVGKGAQGGVQTRTNKVCLKLNDVSFRQICSKYNIPIRYARLMREQRPGLFELNVNNWLRKDDKNFFLRSYLNVFDDEMDGGILRAFLSDKYSPFENITLATSVLKVLKSHVETTGQRIQVERCDLDEKKLYMRFVAPDIHQDAKSVLVDYQNPETKEGGKNIITGFVISNSEVGHGRTLIAPRAIVDACRNGLIWYNEGFAKNHLGARLDEGNFEWSDQTIAANANLITKQVKDALEKFLSPDFLGKKMQEIEELHAKKLQHPVQACKNVSRLIGLTEDESQNVVDFFAKQGSNESLWDIGQALTFHAHKVSPEKAFDIERIIPELGKFYKRADIKEDVTVRATTEAEYEEMALN